MQYRQSKQRDMIYDFMQGIHGHVSAEDVYAGINETKEISLATVYRNLNILVDMEKIKKIPLLDGFVYDKTCNPHYHFYCENCDTLYDIHDRYDETLHHMIGEDNIVGNIDMHDIIFKGTCKKCLLKQEGN